MKRQQKTVVVAAALISLLAAAPNQMLEAKPAAKTAVNAMMAPAFSAKTVQGEPLSSQQLAGKAYIVNFFGSWCPFCRKEIPEMVALQEKYEKRGFTFIGMAYKDNEKAMPDFIWEHNINYPVIMADQAILKSFGAQVQGGINVVPLLFAVGRDGRVQTIEPGAQTHEDLEKLIIKLLKPAAKR